MASFVALLAAGCGGDSPSEPSDGTAPSVTITAPASDGSHLTGESPVDISGTASDDNALDRVEWETDAGDSGTAQGTETWTISDVSLDPGTNTITVTAYDNAGNTGTAQIEITLDTQAPTGSVSSPTEDPSYNTVRADIQVAGTASDNTGIDSVKWSNGQGQSGTASGTQDWSVADLPLALGTNQVSITLVDLVGNRTELTVDITRFQNAGSVTLDPNTVLVGSDDSVRVLFEAAGDVNVDGSSVKLVKVDQNNTVAEDAGTLRDNGDLSNGDDILGDGVYSGLIPFDTGSEAEFRLQVTATLSGGGQAEGRSVVQPLRIVLPTSSEEDSVQTAVQDESKDRLQGFLDATQDVDASMDSLTNWFGSQEGVASAERVGETSIAVEYESGLRGGIFVNQPTDGDGGFTRSGGAATARRPAPPREGVRADTIPERADRRSIPLSQQTIGRNALGPRGGAFPRIGFQGQGTEDEILTNRVLIYAPYEAAFDPYNEGPDVQQTLQNAASEFGITYVTNQQATVDVLKGVTQYGMVVLATHGSQGRVFATGEIADAQSKQAHDALRQSNQIGIWKNVEIADGQEVTGDAKEDVFVIYPSFIENLGGEFPHSLIINASCESTQANDLWNAFSTKGAETYLGFSKVVSSSFAVDMVTGFVDDFATLATAGESFQQGQTDPHGAPADWEMRGNSELHFSDQLINGDFELGDMTGWTVIGDGRVITQLGQGALVTPTQGEFMGITSTGLGFTTAASDVFQSFRVPDDATELTMQWKFLSEEFPEFVGSQFQDFLKISLVDEAGNTTVIFEKAIDQFAADYTLTPVSPEIVFDQGDVEATAWQSLSFDISGFQGQLVTLRIETGDIGDSIYDSATLLDEISVQ